MNDSVWVHNLSPFLVRFSEGLGLRWYGLAYLAGFIVAGLLMLRSSRQGRTPLSRRQIVTFLSYCVFGTMMGGRLGYALFYKPQLFVTFSDRLPYWELLRGWEGGMSSHGGMIGIACAAALFARRHGTATWLHLCDLAAFSGTIGIFFGRIANFINGELFGRIALRGSSIAHWPLGWRVKFPREMYLWLRSDFSFLHAFAFPQNNPPSQDFPPSFLPPQLMKLSQIVPLLGDVKKNEWDTWMDQIRRWRFSPNLQQPEAKLTELKIQALIDRLMRILDDSHSSLSSLIRLRLAPELLPRYPSQLIEAALEGGVVFLIVAWLWRKNRPDGLIAGTWLIAYSLARMIGEQFRLPDLEIGYQLLGLTRGQWFSLGTLAIGLGLLFYVVRTRSQTSANARP